MRITKKMLEQKLAEISVDNQRLTQDNEILKRELHFMAKLMPNASMVIAMERITDALVRTMEVTNELSKRR